MSIENPNENSKNPILSILELEEKMQSINQSIVPLANLYNALWDEYNGTSTSEEKKEQNKKKLDRLDTIIQKLNITIFNYQKEIGQLLNKMEVEN